MSSRSSRHHTEDSPVPPPTTEPSLFDAYIDQLDKWTMKDLQAYSIILRRLDPCIRPKPNNLQTSLELYRIVVDIHKPSTAMPCRSSYTKFISTATEFCNDFQQNLQNFRNAASDLKKMTSTSTQYGITDGMASIIFFEGTAHISWLKTWRAAGASDRDQHSYASLEQMMATLRDVAADRRAALQYKIASATPHSCKPNDRCYLHPKSTHTNK
ncbi:hypothetical protein K3495_g3130 [Podosphaera aphanis]|nr:hypothetical protein K3495_g3130 [Podosphaera aphanis]